MTIRRIGAVLVTVALMGCDALAPVQPGPAVWALPDGFNIGPETTHFLALVTERACSGGRSSEDRIVGPEIEYVDDTAVVVTFGVRPLPGDQECPGNPVTAVEVHLAEPLGNRLLLDGGREPPSEPPVCMEPPFCE